MPAKFLTLDEIQSQRDRALQIGAEHVERFYMELGKGFGRALFYSSMRVWASGPAITAARLNTSARPAIINAWRWSSKLDGVLLKKTPDYDFVPIYMQTAKLAHTLTERGDFFVDFRELRKELGHERE